jgi:hypothetical protein
MTTKSSKQLQKRVPRRQAMLRAIGDMAKELESGSERGLVVLGATIVEGALNELLDAATEDLPKKPDSIADGVLNMTFHQKILMSLVLRGISKREHAAIVEVKNIRNCFAHGIVDFNDDEIGKKVATLQEQLGIVDRLAEIYPSIQEIEKYTLGHALMGNNQETIGKHRAMLFYIAVGMLMLLVNRRAIGLEIRLGSPPPDSAETLEAVLRVLHLDAPSLQKDSAKQNAHA